jgi:phosphoenolpyruvate phosphomutase
MNLDTHSKLIGVGAHDALTAALVEDAGFDIAWVGSFEASARRRLPDVNVLTFTEMAETVRSVRAGCQLPIFVDGDNGYGSDECALRALELFADAGAAAMCIEDNAFPKYNSLYSLPGRRLEDPDVFARRLERLANHGTGVQLVARTEALVAGLGTDEALRRLKWYAQAGVDALFVQVDARHAAELPCVLSRIAGLLPVVVAPTALPQVPAAEFFRMGAAVMLFANVVSRAAILAVTTMLAQLRQTQSLAAVSDQIAGLDTVFQLTGAARWNPQSGAR